MFDRVRSAVSRFRNARSGNVVVFAGLLFPVIGGAAVFAVDHAMSVRHQIEMQKIADSAALTSARQLPFVLGNLNSNGDADTTLTAIADSYVDAAAPAKGAAHTTKANLLNGSRVLVTIDSQFEPLLGALGLKSRKVHVTAAAETFGGENICLISFASKNGLPGITATDSAELQGNNCGVYSNGTGKKSITLEGSAFLKASFICSSGGYQGGAGNTSRPVVTDCPILADPLAERAPPPAPESCDHDGVTLSGGTHTIEPGVYCGKTTIENNADVFLNPGVYVFRGGALTVSDTSRLSGVRVGLYFDDKKATFAFLDDSDIDLAAPIDGPMAGVLLASRPLCENSGSATSCGQHRTPQITSSRVRSLLGTIHLPHDVLVVDTTQPVSGEAAFTIVVVGKIELQQSPLLILNSDYHMTDVPVPQGFEGMANTRIVN